MKEYVAGFMFDAAGRKVALVKKLKFPPGCDWSANPYNAIGGKIEPGEQAYQAMVREFAEETGVDHHGWSNFLELRGVDWVVYFFVAWTDKVFNVQTKEAEKIVIRDARDTSAVIPNLRWIMPLALDENRVGKVLANSK